MNSSIQIIVEQAPVLSSDPLERLAQMSQQASPVDRLRIDRTIEIIKSARQTVAASKQSRQEKFERLRWA
jgi:tRNA A37 N6-isopentenylltransferase MiaA